MRKKNLQQLPLMEPAVDHPRSAELEVISHILDDNPILNELVLQDLCRGKKRQCRCGAKGMSAEQVLRTAIVKQMFSFSYQELAFAIIDSKSIRRFMRIGFADKGFKKSALCKNIKAISPETWEEINKVVVQYAQDNEIEKGREVRIDCTVVESNIHEPTDSSLLFDSIRVLSRLVLRVKEELGLLIIFSNHIRSAKKRVLAISNAKKKKLRKKYYVELIKTTRKVTGYAAKAIEVIDNISDPGLLLCDLRFHLDHYLQLALKVIDQTERRVMFDEKVPASEKIVSIFEEHTDIIIKDRRDTYFGHKICLTGGASNLIIDCFITEGNPADSSLTELMLDRQYDIYGRYPLKVALDGGFASKENLKMAKDKDIKDVCFAKKRGIEVEEMCRSQWVYNRLRRFRAGIEAGISWLKRCFGMTRCIWKGLRSFKSYLWSSIVSANLLTIARKQLA